MAKSNKISNKSSTAVASVSSASVQDNAKSALMAKANTKSDVAVKDRDHIQSQLDKQLQQRPSATDLKNRNILKDTTASPALQAAQNELQRLQLESTLDKKLSNRPAADKLVKQKILHADPTKATLTKQQSSVAPAKAASKSAVQVSKKAEPVNNKQLILHDKKDLQLVVHDAKDYQMIVHDTSKMQLILSPTQKSSDRFTGAYVNNGRDSVIDPTTGSPMSHAKRRKHKKMLKLRDMMIEHQHSHIPVPVSNAGILYDPMQSHKMNSLIKSPASTTKVMASKVAVVESKNAIKPSAATTASKSSSVVKSPEIKSKTIEKVEQARSPSPSRSAASVQASKTSNTKSAVSPVKQQSPQQQSVKLTASPVIGSRSSAGVRVKA